MQPLLHLSTQKQLQSVQGRREGVYIFHGLAGAGKSTAARWLIMRMHCDQDGTDFCPRCRQIEAGSFPDHIAVEPADKPSIGIGQIQALQQRLSLSRHRPDGVRTVVVDPGGQMTVEAQNCLLKTIEEPPIGTLFIITAETADSLLPTVRSRAQEIYFPPLDQMAVADWLTNYFQVKEAAAIAELAGGYPGLAKRLSEDQELLEKHRSLLEQAASIKEMPYFDRLILAAKLAEQPEEAHLWVDLLGRQIKHDTSAGDTAAPLRLGRIYSFKGRVGANVNLKSALEGLMLEY